MLKEQRNLTNLTLTQDPIVELYDLAETKRMSNRMSNRERDELEASMTTHILLSMFENDFLSQEGLPGPRYRKAITDLLTGDVLPEYLNSFKLPLRDIYESYGEDEVVDQMRIIAKSYLLMIKHLMSERIFVLTYDPKKDSSSPAMA